MLSVLEIRGPKRRGQVDRGQPMRVEIFHTAASIDWVLKVYALILEEPANISEGRDGPVDCYRSDALVNPRESRRWVRLGGIFYTENVQLKAWVIE